MNHLSRILSYARPYSIALFASVILMALVGASQGLMVKIIGLIFDRVLKPDVPDAPVLLYSIERINFHLYLSDLVPGAIHNLWTMVAFVLLLCFLVKGVCDYFGNYLVNWVGISAVLDIRQEVFDHVLRQDAQFFESHHTGRIMSSIMNDIEKIQTSVSTMLADWLRQIFTATFLLIAMINIDWRLSLVSFTVVPFVLVPTIRLGKRIRSTTRLAQDTAADLNQILQESITGHQVVKSFGAEDFESNRFRVASTRLKSNSLRYVAQQALASPIIEFFGAVTLIALLSYARLQAKSGGMTPGTFSSFVAALLLLYEPVKRLAGIHNIFQQGLGASKTVFEYLDRREGVMEKPSTAKFNKFEKEVRFRNVTFAYPSSKLRPVLRDIDLRVKAGQVVALVGASGAGKTTMANLVPRFYDVSEGSVSIDGKDVRDLKLSTLRQNISIVAQDTFLFNDTIFNNIAYGSVRATEEAVFAAARTARADDFIKDLPNGYNQVIGERGLKLSGGQRQRLAIARALLKDAPILILDEATSHLDSQSEVLVQQALSALMERRTVIVIAHRLSTIRRAHNIVVLDAGRIVETGTHEDLMSAGGIYQRLHELQNVDSNAFAD